MESFAFSLVLGYLLGSVPFAVIVARIFGLADPRTFGSGNPGATNVLRTGNKVAAALTLLGDAGKGWLAMGLASLSGAGEMAIWAGFSAFLGHLYPLFLKFKGGKGVATALGALVGIDARLALLAAAIWLAVALLTRFSSLAALAAAAVAPAGALALHGWSEPSAVVALMSLWLIVRHRANIVRLLAGTESRIGEKKP